ncbi:MAG: CHAP domain-containing protein [Oscillospiraceae bacterium]|jgi:hypothetical protein|nr:CHAP domain-containing protein [Oscillospiraceae bacterium]
MSEIDQVLEVARRYIGVTEHPSGSNNVLFNTKYYGRDVSGAQYSWCASFLGYCFWEAKLLELTGFYRKDADYKYNAENIALTNNWVAMSKKLGRWVTHDYSPGDCVLFDWVGDGIANHIGIVESANSSANTLVTIEGNTGNAVRRMTRKVDRAVMGAFRPNYKIKVDETMDVEQFKTLYRQMLKDQAADQPDEWARDAAQAAVERGAFKGDGIDMNWKSPVSRQELAIVMQRLGLL